ncbi:MAG: GAF domain-containing protein, partial [Chitinophagaceae bacterium]|nr:GAF domain-containing protein [Chitinophagaceae bacterium]
GFALTDDFIFKCRKWRRLLDDILTTHDEIRINQFVNDEAHPFLKHFQQSHTELQPVIHDYFAQTDPATGQAWLNRRQLEESMQLINGAVNNYLDLMNVEIQQAYPSYFEKFRTDGVEYDIYIGQSIAPDRPFDNVYLKNLRLWQLGSMAAIARLSKMLIPRMQVPLETTQLIFIYSNPIDISFRNDERRFDVEGGYNIRYHILKKRIDKVHIRNSRERLTQPGKIALVYFDQKDADEYISYIQHLQEKNILNNDLEFLELEELQGVSGLRAIRVGIVTEDRSLQV